MQKLKQRPKFYPAEYEFCHFLFFLYIHTYTHTHAHTYAHYHHNKSPVLLQHLHHIICLPAQWSQSPRLKASLTPTSDFPLLHGEETLMSHGLEMPGVWKFHIHAHKCFLCCQKIFFSIFIGPWIQHLNTESLTMFQSASYLSWLQARQAIVGQFHPAIKNQQSWAQSSFHNGRVDCGQDPVLKIGDILPLPKKFGGPWKKKYFM